MALVALSGSGNIWLPNVMAMDTTPSLRVGKTLDAVGEQYALVFEPNQNNIGKSIDKIGIRINSVTASGAVDARLETVDPTDGDPSGALATINSNKSQTVSATGWNQWALTASHTVVAGVVLAVVIEIPSASSAQIITGEHRNTNVGGTTFPYECLNTGAGYLQATIIGAGSNPSLSVGYSDGSWEDIPGSTPIAGISTDSLTSTGTPSEAGLEFQVPFKGALSAVAGEFDCDGNPFDIHLGNASYNPGDAGATRLATRSVDPDILLNNTLPEVRMWELGSGVVLDINTTYRLTFEATSASAVLLYFMDFDSAGLLSAFPGGTSWRYIEDNGAGGWTTTLTRIPFINLGFSKFDDGAGGALSFIQSRRNTLIGR